MEMLSSEAERHRRSSLPLEHAMGLQQASFANTSTRLRQCGLWAWGGIPGRNNAERGQHVHTGFFPEGHEQKLETI